MTLSLKYRPKDLSQFAGQEHIVSKGRALYTLIQNGEIPHCFFYGPPGSGKTTLARIISKLHDLAFYELDASNLKVEDIRKILSKYENSLIKPIIFIDEVHRLSKNQQEILLIPMENEQAIIIGASTENPFFTLSAGIRSRSFLFEFYPLKEEDLEKIFNFVKKDLNFQITNDAKKYLINSSNCDARAMLNLLTYALKISQKINLEILQNLRQTKLTNSVSSNTTHHDLTSSLIKSIRGSDVNASIYYLARLIHAQESADFIARRLVILASEDIGNANPNALNLATNTLTAVSKIGFPEARIILSQCVVYLASSPKSNSSYLAINEALKYVSENEDLEVLPYLKNPPTSKNYLYPHDFGGYVKQKYMQKNISFYNSKNIAFEKTLNQWLEKITKESS